MKKIFSVIIIISALLACKKKEVLEQWPKEFYKILPEQFIKLSTYQGWAGWRLGDGGNKNVAFYVFEGFDTRQCRDCGSPMIAFEFDPKKNEFELKEPQDLLDANAIIGVTSSFGGPMAKRLDSTIIKGQKISIDSWMITIQIQKQLDKRQISGIFKVQ